MASALPPALPPTVEEAYRRKCVLLKQRMNTVSEANEASRLRLVRMERAIQKMRLERAFLLDQLSRRTSANVDDSEGSPSPPPTVGRPQHPLSPSFCNDPWKALGIARPAQLADSVKPKDKPLRIKRGHRKSSFHEHTPGEAAAGTSQHGQSQPPQQHSPTGEGFARQTSLQEGSAPDVAMSDTALPAGLHVREPTNNRQHNDDEQSSVAPLSPSIDGKAFGVFRAKNRSKVARRKIEPDEVDDALLEDWKAMNAKERDVYVQQIHAGESAKQVKRHSRASVDGAPTKASRQSISSARKSTEDVDMDGGEEGGGGFTSVNRG